MIEKLIELIRKAKAEMKKENLSCDIAREYFIAESLIANGVTVQKWIPVAERLPDCADTVLAVDRDGIMSTAYYVGYWHGGGDLDENAVTHWMPLPTPPKGEEQ